MRAQRICERSRDRAQRGLVQHDVDRVANAAAGVEVDYVAVDESVTFPCSFADRTAYFVQVPAMAGLEVIDADDILIEPQERFQ